MQSGRQRKPIDQLLVVAIRAASALMLVPPLMLTLALPLLPRLAHADDASAAGSPARRAQTSCPDTRLDNDATPPLLYALPRCNQWENDNRGGGADAVDPPA